MLTTNNFPHVYSDSAALAASRGEVDRRSRKAVHVYERAATHKPRLQGVFRRRSWRRGRILTQESNAQDH
jgi:hypothetical protein